MIDVYRTTPKDLWRIAREQGRQGYVAASDGTTAGQLHHTKAGFVGVPTPQERALGPALFEGEGGRFRTEMPGETAKDEDKLIQRLYQGLPPVRRRAHEERFRSMFNRLAQTALESYRRAGYVDWPKSVEQDLKVLGWTSGDPKLKSYGGEQKIYKQVEELTRLYIEGGSNKQKVKDQRKITLDWHGHTAT